MKPLRIPNIINLIPWRESLIILAVMLLVSYYFGAPDQRIVADGQGYYDYLPSALIRHDLVRYDKDPIHDSAAFSEVSRFGTYVAYGEGRVDKYFCGTAVLISPVFIVASWFADLADDGYSEYYQTAVYYAALIYLFLALIFIRKFLRLQGIGSWTVFITQVLIVFATSTLQYTYKECAFSHVYSLFAISGFLYVAKMWITTSRTRFLVAMGALLGLIVILRPVNALVVLFIPFLAGSFPELRRTIIEIFRDRKGMIIAMVCFCGFISIQCILWYLQTGDFVLYSYKEEGFNFLKPEVSNVLFSYRKGLFVYAPVLFLSLVGVVVLLYRKQYFLTIAWFLFAFVLVYVLSSWHAWAYGASYGQRPFIEFYLVLFLPLAMMFQYASRWMYVLLAALALSFVPLTVIQIMQYNKFILHWDLMDKSKYWRVFLKTETQWRGLIWKRNYNEWEWVTERTEQRDQFKSAPFTSDTIVALNMPGNEFDRPRLMRVEFENHFNESDLTLIELNVRDSVSGDINYSAGIYMLHFADGTPGEYQKGIYNYELPVIQTDAPQVITVRAFTGEKELEIKNFSIALLKWK